MEQSSRSFEGKYVRVEGKKVRVPEFSKWKEKCSICGCHLVYFPEIKAYFLNQWECDLKYPSITILVAVSSFIFGMCAIIDLFKGNAQILFIIFFSIIFIFWNIAYFCSMCRSPGYLPWYWAVQKGTEYTYEEQMDGVVTSQAQIDFASQFSRPERGSLTRKGRRVILRADHICPWISNWVGLKNYRYFFNQLLYTFVFFLIWFVIFGFVIYDLAKNGWKTNLTNISMIICFVPVVMFFIFFVIVFKRHIKYLCTNMTTLQEFKMLENNDTENPYDLGCWNNCSETLGPKYLCPLWFIPVPIPRINAGIYWHRNDRKHNIDVSKEVPKNDVIYENSLSNSSDENSDMLGNYTNDSGYQNSDQDFESIYESSKDPEIPEMAKNVILNSLYEEEENEEYKENAKEILKSPEIKVIDNSSILIKQPENEKAIRKESPPDNKEKKTGMTSVQQLDNNIALTPVKEEYVSDSINMLTPETETRKKVIKKSNLHKKMSTPVNLMANQIIISKTPTVKRASSFLEDYTPRRSKTPSKKRKRKATRNRVATLDNDSPQMNFYIDDTTVTLDPCSVNVTPIRSKKLIKTPKSKKHTKKRRAATVDSPSKTVPKKENSLFYVPSLNDNTVKQTPKKHKKKATKTKKIVTQN